MGAARMHLKEWHWQARRCRGTLRLRDHEVDVWRPNPVYGMGMLRSMLEESRTSLLWAEAPKHRHGTGMEYGLGLTVTHKNYNWYIKHGKMNQAGALMAVLTGESWPED
eukprot:9106352-Karenia_brevis.AAC.1